MVSSGGSTVVSSGGSTVVSGGGSISISNGGSAAVSNGAGGSVVPPQRLLSEATLDVIPHALYPQPCELYAMDTCVGFRYIWVAGTDGIVRKLDFFASMNNKLHLTQSQRHGLVDSVVKVRQTL